VRKHHRKGKVETQRKGGGLETKEAQVLRVEKGPSVVEKMLLLRMHRQWGGLQRRERRKRIKGKREGRTYLKKQFFDSSA